MNLRNSVRRFHVFIMVFITVLMTITFVGAQEFIALANDRGVQKNVFSRGEGIQIVITLPYSATVQVLLHNPPGTAGPTPTIFIPSTQVQANVQTILGPRWLDDRAPCGKYSLEIRINPPAPLQPKTEYRYLDYAIDERPCSPPSPPPPPPPPPLDVVMVALASAAAIAAVASVLILTRWRARPPKERVVIPPPVPTTPPTPTTPTRPPKGAISRTPIVRGTERDEERL